jgi:hypothetical protein
VARSDADAEARLEAAAGSVRDAVQEIKRVKAEARGSQHYTAAIGYKAFSEVRATERE